MAQCHYLVSRLRYHLKQFYTCLHSMGFFQVLQFSPINMPVRGLASLNYCNQE